MAEYYPLFSRAVAALEKNNGENPRALYARTRRCGVTPALEEGDISSERLVLGNRDLVLGRETGLHPRERAT